MATCTTISAVSTPQITTSLTSTIPTAAQAKRAAIRTVTIKHRAHANVSHARWHRRVKVGPLSGPSVVRPHDGRVYDALRALNT